MSSFIVWQHRALAAYDLNLMGQAGTDGMTVRIEFDLQELDRLPARTNPDGVVDAWTIADELMVTAAQKRVNVLPILRNTLFLPDTTACDFCQRRRCDYRPIPRGEPVLDFTELVADVAAHQDR